MEEKEVGKISHFFNKINVGIIDLSGTLKVGDKIHVKGFSSDFTQTVDSIQIEHKSVEKAGKGDSVGIKVKENVRQGDTVFIHADT